MKKTILSLLLMVIVIGQGNAQSFDKIKFKEYEPGFYQNFILKDINAVEKKQKDKKVDKRLLMDQSGMDLPNNHELYNTYWHNPVISQGNTGTCWCFSTTSMYESEVKRLYQKEVKLSEMFTVYWEYVEKARCYIRERGESLFSQGSEANAVTRIFRKYGAVPWQEYTGLKDGRKYFSHADMYREMNSFLKGLKSSNDWNEEEALETIKSIMNFYMGVPPEKFEYEGKTVTPMEYLSKVIMINPDDYVEILSYSQQPYWKQVEYEVPDNWWHSSEYYNVPLNTFMEILKEGIRNNYTVSIGGDVSEAGFSRETNVALVPDFDIPSDYINENARQFRFSNKTTTDDHGMHLIGFYEKNGDDWYLIKDSSSGSRNVGKDDERFGYYFFSEDYVKLKMMNFTIHKDAIKGILDKFD